MNAECKMGRGARGEGREAREDKVASGQWPVASASNPQSPIPNPSRRGFTLLEVLVSMGVLMLGLLGVAALIPIGKVAMSETNKADRTGDCGRAGLRDFRVRRMLDPSNWASAPTGYVYAIDPLGAKNSTSPLGTTPLGGTVSSTTTMTVQRINLKSNGTVLTADQAEEIFRWHDDLKFGDIENSRDRPAPPATGAYDGSFSWFATVAPQIVQDSSGNLFPTSQACVSIVVCWKRQFTAAVNDAKADETTLSVSCDSSPAYGGMGIEYDANNSKVLPKENEWILLTSTANGQASWYRVVAAGTDNGSSPKTRVSLVGPDWYGGTGKDNSGAVNDSVKIIVVKGVTGVYTTTVKLDNDAIWTK
jgi:hypothetical protein